MLWLAEVASTTVRNPGDDGMSEPVRKTFTRLVEAETEEHARQKVRAAFEVYVPYEIRVDVEVEVHPTIQ